MTIHFLNVASSPPSPFHFILHSEFDRFEPSLSSLFLRTILSLSLSFPFQLFSFSSCSMNLFLNGWIRKVRTFRGKQLLPIDAKYYCLLPFKMKKIWYNRNHKSKLIVISFLSILIFLKNFSFREEESKQERNIGWVAKEKGKEQERERARKHGHGHTFLSGQQRVPPLSLSLSLSLSLEVSRGECCLD